MAQPSTRFANQLLALPARTRFASPKLSGSPVLSPGAFSPRAGLSTGTYFDLSLASADGLSSPGGGRMAGLGRGFGLGLDMPSSPVLRGPQILSRQGSNASSILSEASTILPNFTPRGKMGARFESPRVPRIGTPHPLQSSGREVRFECPPASGANTLKRKGTPYNREGQSYFDLEVPETKRAPTSRSEKTHVRFDVKPVKAKEPAKRRQTTPYPREMHDYFEGAEMEEPRPDTPYPSEQSNSLFSIAYLSQAVSRLRAA